MKNNTRPSGSHEDHPKFPVDNQDLLSLINSSADLIWQVDREGRLLLANEAACEVFSKVHGIDIEPGMLMEDFLPVDLVKNHAQVFARALAGETQKVNHLSSQGIEYATTVQPVRWDGEIVGVSVFTRDVTQVYRLQDELRRYEQIIASSPNLIAVLDRNYHFQLINDAYLQAFNKTRDEVLGTSLASLIGEEHFQTISQPHLAKALGGLTVQYESLIHLPASGQRFLSITYHPLNEEEVTPRFIVINAHDITALRRAEDARQKVFDLSLDMLCILDIHGTFSELNPAWNRILGWSATELKEKNWLDLVDPDDREQSAAVGDKLARGEVVVGFENRCQCKDGTYRWLSWSSYPDLNQQRIFAAVRDISTRKRLENELQLLAITDPLTGAFNRRHFIERASAELERCHRYGCQLAVLMLDIDHFKKVNDNYGHSAGDDVLKRLVECCLQELRSSDLFGRFGGEEFAAILVETDDQHAQMVCQRLMENISTLRIRSHQQEISITASIGLTMYQACDLSIDSLLKRADDALYQAKRNGRNQLASC